MSSLLSFREYKKDAQSAALMRQTKNTGLIFTPA